jgi:hypothetical protein
LFLAWRKQVGEDRGETAPLQFPGHGAVSGAVPAAPAAVREQDDALRRLGHLDVSVQDDPRDGDLEALG